MAQTSQPPMTVDLQPVQLVAADGTPTPNIATAVSFPRRR